MNRLYHSSSSIYDCYEYFILGRCVDSGDPPVWFSCRSPHSSLWSLSWSGLLLCEQDSLRLEQQHVTLLLRPFRFSWMLNWTWDMWGDSPSVALCSDVSRTQSVPTCHVITISPIRIQLISVEAIRLRRVEFLNRHADWRWPAGGATVLNKHTAAASCHVFSVTCCSWFDWCSASVKLLVVHLLLHDLHTHTGLCCIFQQGSEHSSNAVLIWDTLIVERTNQRSHLCVQVFPDVFLQDGTSEDGADRGTVPRVHLEDRECFCV